MERIVLQVDFPSPATDIVYTAPPSANNPAQHSLETLGKHKKTRLFSILAKDSICGLLKEDKTFLWEMRYYCHEDKNSLPKVLASAPNWDWVSLSEIYSLVHQWPPLSPVNALELLDSGK
uniref:Phosphatidylinositol 4-phosphate 3-kinase C2 domain-containing subunit alpha-like n=1 Tax=Geotrypetes seraphini TaxID=260995 RepID=A0A6P8RBP8_GEOSA|nr:phosphatidylinositol 4-phosphate 3-kinase C2 domain-containing subunit alpha-like [Geotrypetes seraphini]